MVRGLIREDKTGRIILTVAGRKSSEQVEVMLDSGFNGDLCIPASVAVNLGLELTSTTTSRLADGSTRVNFIFHGKALWEGNWIEVRIIATNSDTALLGMAFLKKLEAKFNFDFASGTFSIET